jgi:transcription elongation factor Elf1
MEGCFSPPKIIKEKKMGNVSKEFWCPLCTHQKNKILITIHKRDAQIRPYDNITPFNIF